MVGIVSGNSLGLGASSLATLGQRGVIGNAAHGSSGERAYVNVATGNLVLNDTDDRLVARSGVQEVLRTYNSQGLMNDDNSDNWSVGIYRQQIRLTGSINTPGSTMTRIGRDGAESVYQWNPATGSYLSKDGAGAYDKISCSTTQYYWTDGASQNRECYDAASGKLIWTLDSNNCTADYTYHASGNIASVTSSSGGVTYYDYSGNNLTQICCVTGNGNTTTRVRYTYDTSNRLSAVTVDLSPQDGSIADGKTYSTTYTYEGSSRRVSTITQSDGTQLSFTYVQVGGQYKVASVTDALNQTTTFAYDAVNRTATATDPLGASTVYAHDAAGQLTRITAPAVNASSATTDYAYNANGDLICATDAQGRSVFMEYDASGNRVLERDSAGNTVKRSYNGKNQLLTETTYAQPDPDGPGSAVAQGAQTTRYVYDSTNLTRLRFVLSAEGRVTEYRYNGSKERSSSIQYVGGSYSVAALTDTAVPSFSAMLTWATQQNLTKLQRVDYEYNMQGLLSATSSYEATDAQGNGITASGQSITRHVYDQAGLLLQTIAPNGTTVYAYDGMGRLVTSTDAKGQSTLTTYDDAGNRSTIVAANGLRSIRTYDRAGRLVSVQQSTAAAVSLGTTLYFYDAAGRLRMTQDPTGVRTWALFDEAGRKSADIDATGSVTEYIYNRQGQLTRTIRYASAVNTTALVNGAGQPANPALSTIRPPANAADRSEWRAYDDAGRLSKTVDALGSVTEYQYDGASRLTKIRQYGNRISVAALGNEPAASAIAPVVNSSIDRTTRKLYDADGLHVGTLDAEGYLTEHEYDAAGRLLHTARFKGAVNTYMYPEGTLQELRPPYSWYSGDNVWTYRILNGAGRLIAEFDSSMHLTEHAYDSNGNRTRSVRYKTIVGFWSVNDLNPTAMLNRIRPAFSALDRSTSWVYDSLNRVVQETNEQGVITRYNYDAAGNLTSKTRAADTDDVRKSLARYDLQGRLVAELSANGAALLTAGQTQEQIDAIWAQHSIAYTYDMAGRRTSSTDQNGYKTLFFHDGDGRLTHTVNALGEVSEAEYDQFGQVSATVQYGNRISLAALTGANAGGLVNASLIVAINAVKNALLDSRSSLTYAVTGTLTTAVDAMGFARNYVYSTFGQEISRTSVMGVGLSQTVTTSYDRRGLAVDSVRDPGGLNAASTVYYDEFGHEEYTVDAQRNSRWVWRYQGIIKRNTNALYYAVQTNYDPFGRAESQSNELGNVTRFAYDDVTRSVTVTSPEGIVVKTTYDRLGQVQEVQDGRGNTNTYKYDKDGNQTEQEKGGKKTGSQYDRAGRLVQTTDANGVTVTISYDAANRVLSRTVDQGGLALTTSYAYDAKGRQVSVTDPNGVVTQYAYDLKGQLIRQTVDPTGLNLTTSYTYDGLGNVLGTTSPQGTLTRYSYDAAGRRISEQIDPDGLNLTRTFRYDKNDNVVKIVDANENASYRAYDAENRLIYAVDGAGGVIQTVYDKAGRVIKTVRYSSPIITRNLEAGAEFGNGFGGAMSFAAAIAAQLRPASNDAVEHRVLDKDGRIKATISGDGAVTKYWYDANGNVIERRSYVARITMNPNGTWGPQPIPQIPQTADNDTRDLRVRTVYDALNRAIYSINGVGAVVHNVYDGNGNLIERTAYSQTIASNTAATSAAIAAAIAALTPSGSNARVRNVYDKANRLVWSADGTGSVTGLHYDRNGNLTKKVRYATAVGASQQPQTVADSNADAVSAYVYDKANRLNYTVNALGAVVQTVYDKNGNALRTIEHARTVDAPGSSQFALGPSTSYTIDGIQTALATGNAALNRISVFAYDAANRQVFSVDAQGMVTKTTYSDNTQFTKRYATTTATQDLPLDATEANIRARVVSDAANDREEVRQFDRAGRLISSTNAAGVRTNREYDALGRLTKTVENASNVLDTRITTFAYDAAANLISSRDAIGNTTLFTNVDRGHSESFTYDALGNKLSFTNKNGKTWTYEYDAAGRLETEISPEVALTSISTVWGGGLSNSSESDGIITLMSYDALGNLVWRAQAQGRSEQRITRYEYDGMGRQIKTTHASVGVSSGAITSGSAARTETQTDLSTTTRYDALGNAVASSNNEDNVSYSTSYKTYDKLGRVRFEVDCLGGVTQYTRNVFGDVTLLARYATVTQLANSNPAEISNDQVLAAVSSSSADRTLVMEVDLLGRVVKVTEPCVYVFDGINGGNYSKVTQNTYNAFGDLTRVTTPGARLGARAAVNHYYDKLGQRTASVDALGYLTTWGYDSAGNCTETKEFATAIAAWNDLNAPAARPAAVVNASNDRVTSYGYDRLNRKTSETRVDVQYTANGGSGHSIGNLTTLYTYDAVGNQVMVEDAAGGKTQTYYDALGRITAVVAPTVHAGGTTITPLTVYLRDAHGNVVVETQYAKGKGTAGNDLAGQPLSAATDAADRTKRTAYDRLGRAIQTTDAAGVNHYSTYDRLGNVVRQWQRVTIAGAVQTLWRACEYDKLGRLTATLEPQANATQAPSVTATNTAFSTRYVHNAFGEVTSKSSDGVLQEWYRYDNAGRLYASNAGDGNTRFYLHNGQGQQSGEISSAGMGLANLDLSAFSSAQEVAALTNARRIDRQYDANGRMTQEQGAWRQTYDNTTNPDKRPLVTKGYDRWNNVLWSTDARDASWRTNFSYNANNQLIRQSHALQGNGTAIVTQIYYDRAGRQIAVLDANGNLNRYERDAAGNITRELHADGGIVQNSYTGFGEKNSVINEILDKTSYTYDTMGRLVLTEKMATVSGRANAEACTNTLANNSFNNTATSRALTKVASYVYDEAGRRISETNGNEETTNYRFDLRGNLVRSMLAGGQTTRFEYDNQGRKTRELDSNGNDKTWTCDYFGLLKEHKDLGGTTYRYSYDNARQLFSEIAQGTELGRHLRYAYDAAGQLVRKYDWSGANLGWSGMLLTVRGFSADSQATTNIYDYDLAGNRIFEQTLSWGKAVQGSFMSYDSLGRLGTVSNVTDYEIGIRNDFDPTTYMAFNPQVYSAWMNDRRGMTLEEFAVWHYGKEGGNDSYLVTGVAAATTAYQRATAIKSFVDAMFGANRAHAVGAYLLQNRISLTEAAAASQRSVSTLTNWLSSNGVPQSAYAVQAPPLYTPPAVYFYPSPVPEEVRRRQSIKSMWAFHYGNPRMVATVMLEYKITPEELAIANEVDVGFVRQYFSFNGMERSQYDLNVQSAVVDTDRLDRIENTTLNAKSLGLARNIADMMLLIRITPQEMVMSGAFESISDLRSYFSTRNIAREAYDTVYARLPESMRSWSKGGSTVPMAERSALVTGLYQAHSGNLKVLAAEMLKNRIPPKEMEMFNGLGDGALKGRFEVAGISEVNYNYHLTAETSLTRAITYKEVWAQMSSKPTVMVTMAYDDVGNRVSVSTGYLNMPSQSNATKYYQYDAMNRQTVVDAQTSVSRADALTAAQGSRDMAKTIEAKLGSKGHYVTYDKAGNRSSDTYQGAYGSLVSSGNWQKGEGLKVDAFGYDAHGRLTSVKTRGYDANRAGTDSLNSMEIDKRQYDGAGRVVRSGSDGVPVAYFRAVYGVQNGWDHPVVGDGTEQRFNSYDANGRIQRQTVLWSDGNLKHNIDYQQYDAAGNLLKYTMFGYEMNRHHTSHATEYTYSYKRMQGYLEATVSARGLSQAEAGSVIRGKDILGWEGSGLTATTTSSYDRQGHLYRVQESASNGTSKTRSFVNNAEGVVLKVSDSSGTTQTQLVASGQVLGRYGNDKSDFNLGYETVGSNYPASTPANWVVGEGDKLQSIARSVYGNAGQWYLIAEANGLDANSTLRLGQVLSIPKGVGGASNNADTYKPYDARSAVGDTTPALAMPQGNGADGCGGMGQIIMLVVAVAVSIYTLGALSPIMANALASSLGAVGANVAAGAIAGAAGSLASQAVGNAIGAQDGINWKGVALSALSGSISAGLAPAENSLADKTWGMSAARAATASALTQGVAVVTGLQKSFDWRSVAASAVGAGVGAAVNAALDGANGGQGAFSSLGNLGKLARGTMAGIASGTAAAVMRGGRVSIQQVASDAFGNALGSSLAKSMEAPGAQETKLAELQGSGPWSDVNYRNGSDVEEETRRAELQGIGPWSDVNYRNGSDVESDYATNLNGLMNAFNNPDSSNDYPGVPTAYNDSDAKPLKTVDFSGRRLSSMYPDPQVARGRTGQGAPYEERDTGTAPTRTNAARLGLMGLDGRSESLLPPVSQSPVVDLPLPSVAVERPSAVLATLKGVVSGIGTTAYELFSPVADLLQVGNELGRSLTTGEPLRDINYVSAVGRLTGAGASTTDIVNSGFMSLVKAPDRIAEAYKRGDYQLMGEELGGLGLGGVLTVFGARGSLPGVRMGTQLAVENAAASRMGQLELFKNSVFVKNPTSDLVLLNSGISVDLLLGRTRIPTVTAEMSNAVQGMGYINPLTNKFTAAPIGEKMTADHIFPSTKIVELPGFNKLNIEQMTNILQDKGGKLGNLQPLPKSFNSSKGSSTNWRVYKGQALDREYANTLAKQQKTIEMEINNRIRVYQQQNLKGGR